MKLLSLKIMLTVSVFFLSTDTFAETPDLADSSKQESSNDTFQNEAKQGRPDSESMSPNQLKERMATPSEFPAEFPETLENSSNERELKGTDFNADQSLLQDETSSLIPDRTEEETSLSQGFSEVDDNRNVTPASLRDFITPQATPINNTKETYPGEPVDPGKKEDPTEEGDRSGGRHKGQKLMNIPIIRMGDPSGTSGGFTVIKAWDH